MAKSEFSFLSLNFEAWDLQSMIAWINFISTFIFLPPKFITQKRPRKVWPHPKREAGAGKSPNQYTRDSPVDTPLKFNGPPLIYHPKRKVMSRPLFFKAELLRSSSHLLNPEDDLEWSDCKIRPMPTPSWHYQEPKNWRPNLCRKRRIWFLDNFSGSILGFLFRGWGW